MRKLAGGILVLLGVTIAIAHGRQNHYKVVIPKVLRYPTTTLLFSSKSVLAGSQINAPGNFTVKFDDPSWVASVSETHWVTSGGGTFLKFTCAASSASCMQATKGTSSYTYALVPRTQPAPMGYGRYALTWDVNPPGDLVFDTLITVPEIDPTTGLATIALIAGVILMMRGKPRN